MRSAQTSLPLGVLVPPEAKLRMLGIDTLVVERLPKVGDIRRDRYDSLALHNRMKLNSLLYMPYPDTWPTYLTKDHLADWLEAYAKTKPTPQEGLWLIAGGFAQGRVWSHFVALQIKAREAGLVSDPIPSFG